MNISVVIATHNRILSLQETVEDLAKQNTAGLFTFEVIVVDNSSTDDTAKTIREIAAKYSVSLNYAYESKKGKSFALNHGLTLCRGEIVVFTDDDVRVPEDWLQQIFRTFQEYAADGVGGPTKPLWIGARPKWMSDLLIRQLGIIDYGPEPFIVQDKLQSFVGPNCAYRKELFLKLGNFHIENKSSEDIEWFIRVFRSGAKLVYQPAAVVLHKVECSKWTKKNIATRLFRQGRSYALGLRDHGKLQYKTFCHVPRWVFRYVVQLHWDAFKSWFKGNSDEALWHWMRRHIYFGIIAYCFKNWLGAGVPAKKMQG